MTAVAAGKLFGLHSGDGRILWSAALDRSQNLSRLFLSASSHDTQHAPQVLLLGSNPAGGSYLVVNAHSGQAVDQGIFPGRVDKVRLPIGFEAHRV